MTYPATLPLVSNTTEVTTSDIAAVGAVVVIFLVVGFLLFVGAIVALFVFAHKKRKKRRDAIQAFAQAGGHQYVANSPERVKYFSSRPFGTGSKPKVKNVVSGVLNGQQFETFAYQYETYRNDRRGNRRTEVHRFQVTWIPTAVAFPTMRMTPNNAIKRLGRALGAKDLATESDDFNQQWKVWCEDERVSHGMLTPRLIDLFLRPPLKGRGFVFEGSALMTYQSGHTLLQETPWLVGQLTEITEMVPAFIVEELRGQNPTA